jgi:Domain of unknown function (DUF4386)
MRTTRSIGRIVGVLMLVQMVGGVLVNFVLLSPITTPPGFLVNAAANSLQVSLSVLIGLVTGALSLGVAITALPVLRQYSYAMALWFLALGVVSLSLAVVENSAVMSMLSLSQAYTKASAADTALFETLRVVVASSRNWAHYTRVLAGGATFLVFYSLLYRFALIPRALAAIGVIAVLLQLTAITMPFFGYRIVMLMLMPMGLTHLALALWLMVKGFGKGRRPFRAETRPAPPALEYP